MRSPCKAILRAFMVMFRAAAAVLYYPMKGLAAIVEGNRRSRPDAQLDQANGLRSLCMLPGWNPTRNGIWFVLLLVFVATTASKGFSVVHIATKRLPKGVVDISYSAQIGVSDGCTPYTWSITSGSLPQGLSGAPASDTESFLITGIPLTAGTYPFTLRVEACGHAIARKTYTLAISQSAGPYWNNTCTSTISANFNSTPIPGGS